MQSNKEVETFSRQVISNEHHMCNLNLTYAEYGMQFSKARFPLGGINRQDVFDNNPNEIIPQLMILDELRNQYKSLSPDSVIIDRLLNDLRGAFCGEIANIVRNAILINFPQACVEIVSLECHELLLIGRKRGNPGDISTWIDNKNEGYFLDPWAEEIYPISEFAIKKNNPILPFYSFGGANGLTLKNIHYLSGNPRILECTNHYNDEDDLSIKILINKNNQPKALYAKGVTAFKNKNYAHAVEVINKALTIFIQNNSSIEIATSYSTLASCYRELKQYEEAIKCCSLAINLTKEQGGEFSEELKKLNEKLDVIQELYDEECASKKHVGSF